MKKTNIGKALTIIGNVNRIAEMVPHAGDNAISGHFKDEGVNISPEFVRAVRLEFNEFQSKAVSAKATKNAISALKNDKEVDISVNVKPNHA